MSVSLEDKLAIHELLSRSAYGLDERDTDMLAATFAENANFSMRIGGGDLVGPFETRAARPPCRWHCGRATGNRSCCF